MTSPTPLPPTPSFPASASSAEAAELRAMQTIFPEYLDAALTPREGRRLTKAQAVAHPTPDEIINALRALGFRRIAFLPRKSLPRSQGSMRFAVVPHGAVKVLLKEPADAHDIKKSDFDRQTRKPVVAGLESKHEVLKRVAALIKAKGGPRPAPPTPADILASFAVNQPKTKR